MHERKRFVTAITLLLPVLLVSLGGCASKRLTFVKAGAEQADLEHDKNECLRSAIGTRYRGAEILASYCIDRMSSSSACRRAAMRSSPTDSSPSPAQARTR